MMRIFNPLRNWLRQLDQLSLLSTIYLLSNHIEWGKALPPNLRAANPYNIKDPMKLNFYLWELDTLVRETILHSPISGGKPAAWRDIRKALNLLKDAENEAFEAGEYDVFAEMTRIAHRQFHWQQGVGHSDITRYRMIYRHPGLNDLVLREFGLSSEQYFLAAFALMATFMQHFAFTPSFVTNMEKALGFSAQSLVDRLTTSLPELRNEAKRLQSLDIDWAYTFNPLWLHPLIHIDDGRTICPLPGLLARRVTDGLYFDFAKNPDDLSRHMGPAFQAYIGEVLHAANGGRFMIMPEVSFGTAKKPKQSVDWIVEDESGVLFIECKVLRLAHVGRSKLAPLEPIDREFRKIARAVAQTYANLEIALSGEYPHWKPSAKSVYPMVVTMDNWNLFTHVTMGTLRGMISEELRKRGVDTEIIDRHPYTITWARELEMGIQVMNEFGIEAVMRGITREKFGYLFSGYLWSEFREQMKAVRSLFPDAPEQMLELLPKSH